MRFDKRQQAFAACLSALSSPGTIAPFNSRFSSVQPAAIVRPTNAADVSSAIKCGAAAGVPVQALSSGHSYTALGLGGQSGTLVLDMSAFGDMSIDSNGVARVGSAVTLGNLATYIWQNGQRALPHGTWCVLSTPHPTLTATARGYGQPSSRTFGLAQDAVVGFEAVLANGTITNVTSSDADLWFALRGAGGDFAVITHFNLQTVAAPVNPTSFVYKYTGTAAQLAAAMSAYQRFADSDPDHRLTMNIDVFGKANAQGQNVGWDFAGVYHGSQADLETVISPLISGLQAPTNTSITTNDWYNTLVGFSGYSTLTTTSRSPSQDFYVKSIATFKDSPFSDAAYQAFADSLVNQLQGSSTASWFFQNHLAGGQIDAVPSSASAYGLRGATLVGQLYTYVPSGQTQNTLDATDSAMNALIGTMGPGFAFGSYRNYEDDRLQNATQSYYQSNLPRLQQLKQQYDPQAVFRFPNAITPAGGSSTTSTTAPVSTPSVVVVTSTQGDGSRIVITSTAMSTATVSPSTVSSSSSVAASTSSLQGGADRKQMGSAILLIALSLAVFAL